MLDTMVNAVTRLVRNLGIHKAISRVIADIYSLVATPTVNTEDVETVKEYKTEVIHKYANYISFGIAIVFALAAAYLYTTTGAIFIVPAVIAVIALVGACIPNEYYYV